MANKEFPKQWSIKGSIEFSTFLDKAKEKIKIQNKDWSGNSETNYYSFDGTNLYMFADPRYEGYYNFLNNEFHSRTRGLMYPLVTVEQLEEHYLHSKSVSKKIIGYKLIDSKYEKAAGALVGQDKLANYGVDGKYAFKEDSYAHKAIKAAGVLDLWFEPVYEVEAEVIYIGSGNIEVSIQEGIILANGKEIRIGTLVTLYKHYSTEFKLKDWEVKVVGKIKIGCSEFTLDEIKKVIDIYNSFN